MGDESWSEQQGSDFAPTVMDRNGRNIFENTSALSAKDLDEMDAIPAPVDTEDALRRQNMDESIYFLNKTGRNIKIIATTHRVDRDGEDTRDPDNYDQEVNQNLQSGSFFKIHVTNTVWVAWKFQTPGNRYPECGQTICVNDPNGSILTFRNRGGSILPHVTRQEARDPNALFVENRTSNTTIKTWIYKEDPDQFPSTKFQKPAYEATLDIREHYEYTHLINYRIWLVDWFKPVGQTTLSDSVTPSYNATTRESQSKDFRTGTISWWSCAKNVRAGNYVFCVTNPNEKEAKFVFKIFQWEGLRIIPKQQYIISASS